MGWWVSPVENREVRVRDRESQTSELSGGKHSMLGTLEMTGRYTGYTGIDSKSLCWVYQVTGQHMENIPAVTGEYTQGRQVSTAQYIGYTGQKRTVNRAHTGHWKT